MPELEGRHLGLGLEELTERLEVFKTKLVGNFAYCEAGGAELFFSQFNQFIVQVLLGALPC